MSKTTTTKITYRVSKFSDTIRPIRNFEPPLAKDPFYEWFPTFEEAKNYCIDRAINKISALEKEIKLLKKKIPKLEKMTDKTQTPTP